VTRRSVTTGRRNRRRWVTQGTPYTGSNCSTSLAVCARLSLTQSISQLSQEGYSGLLSLVWLTLSYLSLFLCPIGGRSEPRDCSKHTSSYICSSHLFKYIFNWGTLSQLGRTLDHIVDYRNILKCRCVCVCVCVCVCMCVCVSCSSSYR